MAKTYDGYILREVAESFFIALGAYTFVMMLGAMFKPLQVGLGVMFVLKIVPYALPSTLPWTVPISVLTACVIAYGRLSSDNEVTAMKALGTNPFQIIAPALIVAGSLTIPLLFCNHFIEPWSHQKRKGAMKEAALMRPFELLSLEKPVFELRDIKIYIGEATEDRLADVIIFHEREDMEREDEHGNLVPASGEMQVTCAARATYEIVGEGSKRQLHLTLYDVDSKFINRSEPYGYNAVHFDEAKETVSLAERAFIPGWKDMSTPRLRKEINKYTGPDARPIRKEKLNELLTRMRMRWPSAFDTITFALLGVPLGILTRRGRKLVGFGVSVLVVVVIYFPLVVCGKAMSNNGVFMAALWPWARVIVIGILGMALIRRLIKV